MTLARIVLVEDEPDIGRLVSRILTEAGYHVSVAVSGKDALALANRESVDLAIVDLGLPDMEGLTLVRQLVDRHACGIIIVSGRGEAIERIVGLELGADDYMGKPFEPRELLARVRSVLRRVPVSAPSEKPVNGEAADRAGPEDRAAAPVVFEFCDWRLDTGARQLAKNSGAPVPLTSGEFDLLLALVKCAGRVLTREQMLDATHGVNTPAFDRSVDVAVGRIRRKVEADPKNPSLIKTVRNCGYVFTAPVRRLAAEQR